MLPIINQFNIMGEQENISYIVESDSRAENLIIQRIIYDYLKNHKNVLLISSDRHQQKNLMRYLSQKKQNTLLLCLMDSNEFLQAKDEDIFTKYSCIILIAKDIIPFADTQSARSAYYYILNKIKQKFNDYEFFFTLVPKTRDDIIDKSSLDESFVKNWLSKKAKGGGFFFQENAAYVFSVERSQYKLHFKCLKDRISNRKDTIYDSGLIINTKNGNVFADECGLDEVIDILEDK